MNTNLSRQPTHHGPAICSATSGQPRRRSSWQPRLAVGGYIDGLDGVRALAVTMVVAFHLWPNRFPGGFIGVDVFFVISGFLITTLLVREHERTSRIDLVAFWQRRARRLLPPLVAMVFVALVAARVTEADLLVGVERQTTGAVTFSTNWLEISADVDYFSHSAPQLFSTLWSLAVEEQFYVVWPLLVIALLWFARTAAARVRLVLAVAAMSALLMGVRVVPNSNPTRVYYGTDTHLFGLMTGAGLAFAMSGNVGVLGRRRWLHLRRWVGFVAIAGLVVLGFVLDSTDTMTYRGGLLLASALSAAAVASLPGPTSSFTRVCSLAPLSWIGRRSYGIYLWHWPVILVLIAAKDQPFGLEPDWRTATAAIVLTVALAQASWALLERPIQREGFGWVWCRLRQPEAYVAALTAAIIAICVVMSAPGKTSVQAAVESGEQLIEQQQRQAPTSGRPGTTPTTTSSAPALIDGSPVGQPVSSGDAIIGIGDSVMSGGASAIYHEFPGIVLDAAPNRQWKDAPEIVRRAIDNGTMRPVVILDLGTNAGLTSDEQRSALRETLDLLGPDRAVVLVNVFSPSSFVTETNAALAEAAAERPNTIVADWNATVSGHYEYLHDDATHPNMKGIYVYTDMLVKALQQLGTPS